MQRSFAPAARIPRAEVAGREDDVCEACRYTLMDAANDALTRAAVQPDRIESSDQAVFGTDGDYEAIVTAKSLLLQHFLHSRTSPGHFGNFELRYAAAAPRCTGAESVGNAALNGSARRSVGGECMIGPDRCLTPVISSSTAAGDCDRPCPSAGNVPGASPTARAAVFRLRSRGQRPWRAPKRSKRR